MERHAEMPIVGAELRARIGAFGRGGSLSQRIEARTVSSTIVVDLDADEIELPSSDPELP